MNVTLPLCSPFTVRDAQETINYLNVYEATDRWPKHVEYTDGNGVVIARYAKVYKKTGLFHLFNADSHQHGEIKDADGHLLLTITSYWGATHREAKVEIHYPDGTLLGTLYDADKGADFESPDGTLIGKARRLPDPENLPVSKSPRVVSTYMDASEQIVGTCISHTLPRDPKEREGLSGVAELVSLSPDTGTQVQTVTLETTVDPLLHTFLFLFPALNYVRTVVNE